MLGDQVVGGNGAGRGSAASGARPGYTPSGARIGRNVQIRNAAGLVEG